MGYYRPLPFQVLQRLSRDLMEDNPFDMLTSFISEASNALGHSVKKKKLKYCRATCPDPHVSGCGLLYYYWLRLRVGKGLETVWARDVADRKRIL